MTGGPVRTGEHEASVVDQENPWPGLAPFAEEHARFFHGRQREVEELLRRVRLNALTVLYGQSGLGKTSLVQAALYPKLRAAGLLPVPIRITYTAATDSPREQIWRCCTAAFTAEGITPPPLPEGESLWEYFHRHTVRFVTKSGHPVVPVLAFDQFEELFTIGSERSADRSFARDLVDELAALVENRPSEVVEGRFERDPKLVAQFDFDRQDYRVLISLREDYLAHLHWLSRKMPSVTQNNMRLTPLDGVRALDAVIKPGGRLVTREAAAAIVRYVAGTSDERREQGLAGLPDPDTGDFRSHNDATSIESLTVDPSLLSLFCSELNNKRKDEALPAITPELVESNREDILRNFYARALAKLPEGVRHFIEESLLTESGFRETLALDTAQSQLRRRGVDPAVLTTLVNRRLLHLEERGGMKRVELTHDVLAPVVRQSRTERQQRERVAAEQGRRELELEEARRLAQAAQEEAERRQAEQARELAHVQRQRKQVLFFGIAMAVVAGFAIYQTIQAGRQSAEAERQRQEAVSGRQEADRERDRARLLADSVSLQNGLLATNQTALERQTVSAETARDQATLAQRAADSTRRIVTEQLADMCRYSKELGSKLADTASANQATERLYAALVTTSDTYIKEMRRKDPGALCPLQLETRFETIGARQLYNQARALPARDSIAALALAREHAMDGVRSLAELAARPDSESREIAVAAHLEYVSLLPLLVATDSARLYRTYLDTAERVARHGLALLEERDPARDRMAYYRRARMHMLRAAVFRPETGGEDSARASLGRGLAVVAEGMRHPNQNKEFLYYAAGELHSRLARQDSASGRGRQAIAHARELLDAAVGQFREVRSGFNYDYLGWSYERLGNLLRAEGDSAGARVAYDSSEVVRARLAGEERPSPATPDDAESARLTLYQFRTRLIDAERRAGGDPARILTRSQGLVTTAERMALPTTATTRQRNRLGVAYNVLSRALLATGDYYGYLAQQRRRIEIDSAFVVQSRHHPDTLEILARAYEEVATVSDSLAQRADAVRFQQLGANRWQQVVDTLTLRRGVSAAALRAARRSLAGAHGNLSWYHLFNREPALAVSRARDGIAADSTQTFIYTNLVSGLLLSGRADSAEVYFRRMRDVVYGTRPRRFGDQVIIDLGDLAKAGVAKQADVDRVRGWARP
ncbi:MAG: hypothetical protein HOP28_03450 [Gemmatimonadales bacterium]|nr:hypothetical protein [Gemmatimonadales bacterium]